jgi:hypothetical protein
MYYPRTMESALRRLSTFFPAVVLTGARQAGKTTLLRRAFPDHSYVSLDLPTVAEQAEETPDLFLSEHPPPLIVDEIQYAPGLFRHLKVAIDSERHTMGRYLLTGSQHFRLMRNVSDSLAGRCGLVELENLSLDEIRARTLVEDDADAIIRMLVRGQFPELWRVRELPTSDFYAPYLATYLERDVREILNVRNLRDFERFIRSLAARSATQLNKSHLARDVGISTKAVSDWLSVLETSGQIVLLQPWHTNFGKRMARTPKVYFRDTGLLCFLLNLNEATLPSSPFLGAVWETFVYAEIRKLRATADRTTSLWTYRDRADREIDFVLEQGGRLSFIECKWGEQPGRKDARTIRKIDADLAASAAPWQPERHYVVGRPHAQYAIAPGVMALRVRDLPAMVTGAPAGDCPG